MEHQNQGFLNDTSLTKTPKSPLKTSTVLRPNQRRRSGLSKQKANYGTETSYLSEGCSFPSLHEVTNIPTNAALKMKFNESTFADNRNSSLGILQMENFSDFTDTSLHKIVANSKPKAKSKKISKSKLCNSKEGKVVKKKSFPPDTTVLSAEDLEDYRNLESSSSSDIEYDGTNIPELNLDYDPMSSHKKSSVPKNKYSEGTKQETEPSFVSTMHENNNSDFSNTSIQSAKGSRSIASNDSTRPRDSIFETFDPAYDSIFKTLMPSDGVLDINSTKMSELMKGPPFLDLNSTEIDSIFKNQSLAERNFMKNMEKLSSCDQNSPIKFCTDEISARSSSFRSAGESTNASKTNASSCSSQSLNAEDFVDEVLGRSSFVGSSMEKSESYDFTSSFQDKSSAADSTGRISKSSTFVKSESDATSSEGANFSCTNTTQDFEYPSDLNFKDMSMFVTKDVNEQNYMEVSDSEFISPGEAMELFKKDEEILNEEKRFEIGNDSKGSVFSISSPLSRGDVSAPPWFLELSSELLQHPERISIGTLISARTECLGRLSQDSKRERPFFGTVVTTPVRDFPGGLFALSESVELSLQSTSDESTPIASQQTSTAVCETPKSHFDVTGVLGNNASALRDVLQNYPPDNESELIRASALSEFLNELSTNRPSKLASKILEKCRPLDKHPTNHQFAAPTAEKKKNEQVSPNTTLRSDKLSSTLTRSSSEGSLGDIATETPKNLDKKALSISNVELNNANIQNNGNMYGCPSCQQQKAPFMYSRPPSSCSTLCGNPMPIQNALQGQYGCMKYLASSQDHCHQNLFSSWGSIPRSDNGSHSCQSRNPYVQDMWRSQMGVGPQQTPMPPNCAQFPVAMQGSVYSCPTLQGPTELVFPEKLSVGDSQCINITVQNLHNLQFYHVSFVSASLNDVPVSLEIAGLSFPGMVPCSSNNTTDIQITLSPKYDGKIIVVLQIIASYNSANIALAAFSSLSLQTKIKYESIRPCISISSKGQSKLDLDKVIAGSTVVEYITISNRCDAAVPLYISLSNDVQDNHITFGLNHMKRQKHPAVSGWKMLSPKTMRYHLPCSKEASVVSQVDIPIIFEAGNQDADVNFTLTAAVESYSVRETLGWFRISASVGNAKLVLVDLKQNRLLLNTRRGATCSKTLNIKNDGSFPVIYDLAIVDDTESFSVSPSSVNLKPMQSSSISISFSPTSAEDVKGILQAAAQPHGRISEVAELFGNVKSVPRNQGSSRSSVVHSLPPERGSKEVDQKSKETRLASRGSSILECNKKYLSWGGIDIGNSVIKTFDIKNSSNKSIKTKLFIKENSNSFKLLGEGNQHLSSITLGLNAKEQRTVSVVFAPTKTEPSSGFLVVKPLLEKDPKIFSMPLSGYGGTGKLKVSQVTEKEGIGSCLDIVLPVERRTVFTSITVHNAGVRALFVKAVFSPAVSSETEVRVSIDPQEYVLCEMENKTLYISYTCEELYGVHSGDCGVITLLYGDEVLRQQMRRSNNETSRSTQNDLIRNINFDGHYTGEEKVPYDPLYQCIPRIFSVFSMSVKRYLIHLNVVEQNASCSQLTFDAMPTLHDIFPNLTCNSTVYPRRLTTASNMEHSPPVQDFTVHMLNRLSMPLPHHSYVDELPQCPLPKTDNPPAIDNVTSESWTAKPEILVIDSNSKDNRVSLVNITQHDLKFKIESAIDVISVSPVSGIIPAKGQIGLRITIIPFNYSKLYEDYKGYIKVICDGKEKNVLVNVIKDQRKGINVPESNVNTEVDQESIAEESLLDRVDNTIIGPPSIFIKDICDFPKEITLSTTVPGKVSENYFTIQNSEKVSTRWNIRSISTLFSESLDDSSLPTQVLQIRPSSGILKSMEVSNIVIKCMPSRQDNFSQFFELSLVFENGLDQKCNFKVYAKASTCLTESTEVSTKLPNAENPRRRSKESVYIENENCDFPNTALGQSSVLYATVKNISSRDVTLDIIKPHLPFVVTQSSMVVKSKKFVKIPISFAPKDIPKVYEDVLFLHSDEGHNFMFYLKATCIEKKK